MCFVQCLHPVHTVLLVSALFSLCVEGSTNERLILKGYEAFVVVDNAYLCI